MRRVLRQHLGALSWLTRVNVALATLIVAAAVPGALRTLAGTRAIPAQVDFATYYLGAAILNSSQPDLYREDLLRAMAASRGVASFAPPYVYPPLFAGLLRPLAGLPYDLAKGCWLALNLSSLMASSCLLVRLAGLRLRPLPVAAGLALVLLFPPGQQALDLGQVSPLLLALCAGALCLALAAEAPRRRLREAGAGALIALATMVKVVPGLLVPYLAATRRRALCLYALAGLAILLAFGAILGGGTHNTLAYLSRVLPSLYGQRLSIAQLGNQSLSAFFMRLFTPTTVGVSLLSKENGYVVALFPLANSRSLALAATYASSLLILAATGAVVWRACQAPLTAERWALGGALVLTVPLLVVSSAYYHLHLLLLLPLALLVRLARRTDRAGILTLALVIYLLVVVHRYANWLVVLTSSPWLASCGLYGALLAWAGTLYLFASRAWPAEGGG